MSISYCACGHAFHYGQCNEGRDSTAGPCRCFAPTEQFYRDQDRQWTQICELDADKKLAALRDRVAKLQTAFAFMARRYHEEAHAPEYFHKCGTLVCREARKLIQQPEEGGGSKTGL